MGLLDSILGSVLGGGQSQNTGQAALINAVIQMIANKGGSGGGGLGSVLGSALGGGGGGGGGAAGGLGGLGGLIGALTQGGLGNVASSWVGTGQNLPVSAEQLQAALGGGGGGLLAQLAQQAGMSHGEAASNLSQILPDLVDKLTPDGQLPQQDSLEKMLGSLNIGR